ncbi:DEKNAAC104679 [Brettanomyces naardenensis]|uniref:DEKNAAC104679 n=1 Tax=Brettanomyces naardenensis TaxID=13370 RepID=A0A448YQZ3_BRENA|nr:DEKNAAC104679 [Brettanomyces naardenensis]
MRVLLTNDDGGPNDVASPYVKFLVEAIEKHTDWALTICVPSCQKSWIGKAHFAGKDVTVKYIYSTIERPEDNSFHGPFGYPQERLRSDPKLKEWCLVDDGTPATCADIGINHVCNNNVDLVLSGPNVGRNSTALYALSSGTIGGAMEGCSHGQKAIAISYAYENRFDTDPRILREASLIAVKVVQNLYDNWREDIDLYSINIPLVSGLKFGKTKIYKVPMLQNKWRKSLFQESKNNAPNAESMESDIIDQSVSAGQLFKWSPDFALVHKDVASSPQWSDGKAIAQGSISVTAIKAVFEQVDSFNEGELILE